jgi:formate hydrogenlyase subunit 3/multisubunit Na+/H+ antiporter MnhD subunit
VIALGVFALLDASGSCSIFQIDEIDLDGPILIALAALMVLLFGFKRRQSIIAAGAVAVLTTIFVFIRLFRAFDLQDLEKNSYLQEEAAKFGTTVLSSFQLQATSIILAIGAALCLFAAIWGMIIAIKRKGADDVLIGGEGIYDD